MRGYIINPINKKKTQLNHYCRSDFFFYEAKESLIL